MSNRSFFDNPFGGIFDFNGDGKEDFAEKVIGMKVIMDFSEENEDEDEHSWHEDCENGSEYGLFPENFETEDEYEDALEEAKYGWRDLYEDDFDLDIDPEDFETEDEYLEAVEDAREELGESW